MSFTLLSGAFKEALLVMIHYVADSERKIFLGGNEAKFLRHFYKD